MWIVTTALAEADASAVLTAVTLTLAGEGTATGARYKPAALMVPRVELPPVTPFTFQITDVFALF